MTLLSPSSRWMVAISLFSLSAVGMDAFPGHAQSAGGGGSLGSPLGDSHESSKPGKPRAANPADTMRNVRPPDKPGLRLTPREQTMPLEERLQRGQMEEAVAQGQISDRLEQFHKGSAEGHGR